jgi:DNA-binding transcriptional LysR family regulator
MSSIKEFQTFAAIVQERSFTKAAEKTFQSQSAVSKQLKKLETVVGVKLIERYEREVLTTEFGEVFYQHAIVIIESYNRALEAISELQDLQGGFLDIGASTLPGEYILPNLIGKFKKQFPKIDIRMQIAKTDEVIAMLKNRKIQVAFIGANVEDDDIEVSPYIDDELILIRSNCMAKVEDRSNLIIETALQNLIIREQGSGTRKVVEEFLVRSGYKTPANAMELGSNRAILSAVASGIGYSFLSKWVIQDAVKLGQVEQVPSVEGNIKRKIYTATLKNRYINPATIAFLEYIK